VVAQGARMGAYGHCTPALLHYWPDRQCPCGIQ
jgi:hypothetical protein